MNELSLAAALEAFYQQVTVRAAFRGWPVISRKVFWRLLYGEHDTITRLRAISRMNEFVTSQPDSMIVIELP